jgi:micrococcal nuclease
MNRAVLASGLVVIAAVAAVALPRSSPQTLTGRATVVDGDTLRVGRDRIKVRLHGIDAAERGTTQGESARELMISIVEDRVVTCTLTGERSYDRVVATCRVGDNHDVAEFLVRHGRALDCPHFSGGRYAAFEPAFARQRQRQAPYCRS